MYYNQVNNTLSVWLNNKAYVCSDANDFADFTDAYHNKDVQALTRIQNKPMQSLRKVIKHSKQFMLAMSGDSLVCEIHGKVINLPQTLVDNVVNLSKFGEQSLVAIANFIERLAQNPSNHVFNGLNSFLNITGLTLTENGHIVAFKAIRNDWLDIYSGTVNNSIGTTVEMLRLQVDDNPANGCSTGLHVGSLDYIESYGSIKNSDNRIIMVTIDPADVVSVPSDHSFKKMRVCKYFVVKEVSIAEAEQMLGRPFTFNEAIADYDEDYDYDDYDDEDDWYDDDYDEDDDDYYSEDYKSYSSDELDDDITAQEDGYEDDEDIDWSLPSDDDLPF